MNEQAQVVEVRRRRSSAEVEQLVAEYEGSGLGRVEFCQAHQLSLATLARYRKRRVQASPARESRWVAVEVAGSGAGGGASSGLTVVLARGRRVEIGRSFDAQTLMRVLSVLEQA
jgi:hypothetical protein